MPYTGMSAEEILQTRIDRCDWWRTRLTEITRLVVDLSVELESAELESRKALAELKTKLRLTDNSGS